MIAFPDSDRSFIAARHRSSRRVNVACVGSKMVAQTEAFINAALKNPELAVVIPTVPVGSGCFPKGWSSYFWQRVLGSD